LKGFIPHATSISNPLRQVNNHDLFDILAEIESTGASDFGLVVQGQPIRYNVRDQMLRLGDAKAPLKLGPGRLRLRILVDRSSLEVFADRGQVTLSAITLEDKPDISVRLVAE